MQMDAMTTQTAAHGRARLVGVAQRACWIAVALFAAVYLEVFLEVCATFHTGVEAGLLYGTPTLRMLGRAGVLFVIALAVCWVLMRMPHSVANAVFRYRYLIALVLFAVLVLAEISFSSLGAWATELVGGNGDGLLFGIPRGIRSDEFNVSTLFNFSQEHTGYQAWSDILNATPTDTRLVYNMVSWSAVTLFRPLLWGYLLLGSAKGLSFYFCFKLFGVFFASLECARVFTHDNRTLSIAFAVLVTFSPVLVWWSYWEGIIYGQLLVAAFYQYLHARSNLVAALWGVGIAWLCGCYLFLLYPAWMVPFFYVFAVMGIIVLVQYVGELRATGRRFERVRLVPLLAALVVLVVLAAYILMSSSAVLASIGSTVYPGDRFSTGGGYGSDLFNGGNAIFFSLQNPDAEVGTPSELSSTFSLFPLGMILASYTVVKTRKRPLLALLVLQAVFVWYIVIGFPAPLSLITLFSNSPSFRVLFASEYLEVVLVLSSCAVWSSADARAALPAGVPCAAPAQPRWRRLVAAGAVVLATVALVVAFQLALPGYSEPLFIGLLALAVMAFLVVVYHIVRYRGAQGWQRLLAVAACCVVGVSGMTVNPIQRGIAPVTESAFATALADVLEQDPDATVMAEGPWYYANLCAALGAPTIGTTNMYPDMAFWHTVDPTGAYDEYYNRYAHVNAYLVEGESVVSQLTQDSVSLGLSADLLDDLGVTYLVSVNDRAGETMGGVSFELVGQGNNLYIYRIVDAA